MSKLAPVRVSTFEKKRAEKHVDREGKYPYLSDIMTAALTQFIDKLEAKKK